MASSFFVGEGNLGSIPNLKRVPSSQGGDIPLLEFSIRVNVDRRNKQSGEYEDTLGFWADVSYWGKAAEVMAPLLQKGARVLVVGELGMDEWISNQPDTQGQERKTPKIKADHVGILPWGVEQVIYRQRNQPAPVQSAQPTQSPQPILPAHAIGNDRQAGAVQQPAHAQPAAASAPSGVAQPAARPEGTGEAGMS